MSAHCRALHLLGLREAEDPDIRATLDEDEVRLGQKLPAVLRRIYETPGLVDTVDGWFSNELERPGSLRVYPSDRGLAVPPMLWIVAENQGVCHWVVPLGEDDDPPVYVTGDLYSGEHMTVFAPSVSAFFTAVAWDIAVLAPPPGLPMIQAQAAELDPASIAYLKQHFDQLTTTYGWPCPTNYRFQRRDQAIELWSCEGQCDWALVAESVASLDDLVGEVIHLSDLRSSLWSNETDGEAILNSVRSRLD